MLLKRLLLRCAMRQLLVKQSTIVRNGSRREVSWLLCILPFDFIRLFRLLLVRSLALAAHNWGVRKLYENMYLCQAIAKSPGEWHQDFILSSFWPLHKKHTKSEHCKWRDKATVSKLMQQIFILAFFGSFFVTETLLVYCTFVKWRIKGVHYCIFKDINNFSVAFDRL